MQSILRKTEAWRAFVVDITLRCGAEERKANQSEPEVARNRMTTFGQL